MIPSMTALVPTCRKIALLTAIDRAPVRCRMTDHHRGPCVPASLDRRWPTGRPIPTTFARGPGLRGGPVRVRGRAVTAPARVMATGFGGELDPLT